MQNCDSPGKEHHDTIFDPKLLLPKNSENPYTGDVSLSLPPPTKAVAKREISIKCCIRLRKGEMRCWDYRSERLLSWDC